MTDRLKWDVVKVGEFTYELRDKTTGDKVNICDVIADKFERGEIKKK